MKQVKELNLWKKFMRFLLIGASAVVLLFAAQSLAVTGFSQQGPQSVFADCNDVSCDTGIFPIEQLPGTPIEESPIVPIEQLPGTPIVEAPAPEPAPVSIQPAPQPAAPAAPAVSCPVTSDEYPQCGGTTGLEDRDPTRTFMITRFTDCRGNIARPYQVRDLGNLGQCQQAPARQPFVCPKVDVVRVEEDCFQGSVCKFNVWQGPGASGECINGRGGAFGCQAVPGRCGLPAQPAPPAPQPPAQRVLPECNTLGTQFICGQLTFDRCSFNADGSVSDCVSSRNPNCHSGPIRCDRPQQPAPARPVAPAINQQCPAGTTVTTVGSTIVCQSQQQTQTNNQVVTVTVPNNPAVRAEIVREVREAREDECPANTTKRVENKRIICIENAPVVRVAGVETKELPKTGLPLLAWAAAAFIPAGTGLKRFKRGISAKLAADPNYLWEDRQFKI